MKKDKVWYKKASNWLYILACVILVPILIANIYIMFQSKADKDKVPNVFGYKPFIVLSGSMEVEIHKGDLVITKMVNPKTLKKKDIIAFRDTEGTVTTHRIIDIVSEDGKKYFITKGDNNSAQDQKLVEFKDVEGLYVGRIPGVGSIMNSLSEPTTIVILLLGITVIFVLGFMISTKKQQELEYLEFKRQKEEEAKKKLKKENSKKKESNEDS